MNNRQCSHEHKDEMLKIRRRVLNTDNQAEGLSGLLGTTTAQIKQDLSQFSLLRVSTIMHWHGSCKMPGLGRHIWFGKEEFQDIVKQLKTFWLIMWQTEIMYPSKSWKLRCSLYPFVYIRHCYLGENGEMSCISLAQVIMGGGELLTSHGSVTSSPASTEISMGLSGAFSCWSPGLDTLGLTMTQKKLRSCNEYINSHKSNITTSYLES